MSRLIRDCCRVVVSILVVIIGLVSSSSPVAATQDGALPYPFDARNMFFGLTFVNATRDASYVEELGASWLSLQPHVLWMMIEKEPGVYDWDSLDREVRNLQALDLDITMVLSPIINAFSEQRAELIEVVQGYPSMLHFLRQSNVGDLRLYPHDETLPLWIDFVKAAVERYDGDGINDMPGLKYQVRNWHFVEEYPTPSIKDEGVYVELLKITYESIKSEDPNARVILAGLDGNFARIFAFMDGFIDDAQAGVINSVAYTQKALRNNPVLKNLKSRWEYIVRHGKGYFDVFDLHAYIIKETFMEGEIEYVRQSMLDNGYLRPIWIIEGGGPFKNYPGKRAENSPADPYFGFGSHKENAEFVIKLHAMSAAKGVERQHWGLGGSETTEKSYWDGPWCGMGLIDGDEQFKRPSYYTFKIMVERLDGFTEVKDLSFGNARVFSFDIKDREVFVIWNDQENAIPQDLSGVLGDGDFRIMHIVTELDESRNPVYKPDEVKPATSIPVSMTPIFVETAH